VRLPRAGRIEERENLLTQVMIAPRQCWRLRLRANGQESYESERRYEKNELPAGWHDMYQMAFINKNEYTMPQNTPLGEPFTEVCLIGD
jgi:hypothetical protein